MILATSQPRGFPQVPPAPGSGAREDSQDGAEDRAAGLYRHSGADGELRCGRGEVWDGEILMG